MLLFVTTVYNASNSPTGGIN